MFYIIINEGEGSGCIGGAGGSAASGGMAGGDMSPGVPSGPAGGITSDAVLGPSGGFEKGKGCLGPGDFHVPFPVMPVLHRYQCCNGGSLNKKKKGKKTVSVKNPYAKGMKTIVAEAEIEPFEYQGEARKALEAITDGRQTAYGGVLYFNDRLGLAWKFDERDGLCKMFKPVMSDNGIWTVYATTLTPEGDVQFDYRGGRYRDKKAALDAIYKAAQEHAKKLNEALQLAAAGNRTLVVGISQTQAESALKDSDIDNPRFNMNQFLKYGGDPEISYVGLFDSAQRCLAMAAVKENNPFPGYLYIAELQRVFSKGAGTQLLAELIENYGKVWLACDANGGDKLLEFYRKPAFGLEEYEVKESVWGCPASFFYTKECEERILGYIDAFYDNGTGDEDDDEEEPVEENDLIIDYMNAVMDEDDDVFE